MEGNKGKGVNQTLATRLSNYRQVFCLNLFSSTFWKNKRTKEISERSEMAKEKKKMQEPSKSKSLLDLIRHSEKTRLASWSECPAFLFVVEICSARVQARFVVHQTSAGVKTNFCFVFRTLEL